MKIYKKIVLLLACISACISIFFILQIYAKYLTSATGSADLNIAKWNIKVNNNSINNSVATTIAPVFEGTDHIASNVIAPTAEGYFDLAFDFTDVDVSFLYDIAISTSENSSVSDLVISAYSIDDGPITSFEGSSRTISDTIIYSDNISARTIRVYISWNDDAESASMDNSADTIATSSGINALIDVIISFTQVVDS